MQTNKLSSIRKRYSTYLLLDSLIREQDEVGITLYHHDKRRSGEVVKKVLGKYSGYIYCDMWGAY